MKKEELLDKLKEYKFTTHKVVLVKRLPSKTIITNEGIEIPAFEDEQDEIIEIYNNEEFVDYLFDGIKKV